MNSAFGAGLLASSEVITCEQQALRETLKIDHFSVNALTAVGAFMTPIDFTLSNARRFNSSMGNPLAVKGLIITDKVVFGDIFSNCEVHTKKGTHFGVGKSGGYLPRRFVARQISITIHLHTIE